MSEPLTAAAFAGLIALCGARHQEVLQVPELSYRATAVAESDLRPLVIHDNAARQDRDFATPAQAIAAARQLLAQGHSIDAGVMQLNVSNWPAYGLSVETVFDTPANVCAGAMIYAEDYAIERAARCRYNSGRPACPDAYPDRVGRIAARLAYGAATPAAAAAPPPPPCPADPAADPAALWHRTACTPAADDSGWHIVPRYRDTDTALQPRSP